MPSVLRTVLATLLLAGSAAAQAVEPLTQVTISVYSGGREVAGWVYPAGERVGLSATAIKTERTANGVHYTGNIMGRSRRWADAMSYSATRSY